MFLPNQRLKRTRAAIPVFPGFNVLASGPGSLALAFGCDTRSLRWSGDAVSGITPARVQAGSHSPQGAWQQALRQQGEKAQGLSEPSGVTGPGTVRTGDGEETLAEAPR